MLEILTNFKNCVINNYFNFKGRASRKEYWYFALIYYSLYLPFILFILSFLFGIENDLLFILMFIALFGILGIIAITCPFLALTVRRLHDIGKSGWWLGGYFICNFIVASISASLSSFSINEELSGISLANLFLMAVLVFIMLVWSFLLNVIFPIIKGDKNANKYGDVAYKGSKDINSERNAPFSL